MESQLRPVPIQNAKRSDVWQAALLFSLGAAIAALSAAVLVIYHGGPAMLTFTGVDRIQYDTVWVFTCLGVALMTFALGFPTVSQAVAGIGVLISTIRIAAYAFPGAIDTRPILANPWLTFKAGEYNSMGVLTALVALVLGVALILLRPPNQRGPWRPVWLAVLASIAIAVSLLMAVAAWSGSS